MPPIMRRSRREPLAGLQQMVSDLINRDDHDGLLKRACQCGTAACERGMERRPTLARKDLGNGRRLRVASKCRFRN